MQDLIEEAANRLQSWDIGLSRLACKEVLGWADSTGTLHLALRGDALRIERGVLAEGMINNYQYHLDVSLQQAFGLDAKVEYQGMRPVGVRGGIGQTMDQDDAHISQVFDAIQACVAVGLNLGDEAVAPVALMPMEGEPWDGVGTTEYYNAKKRRWATSSTPEWITQIYHAQGSGTGADFCKLMPVLGEEPCGYFSGEVNGQEFFVSHSVDFEDRKRWKAGGELEALTWEFLAQYVNDCGGLLFPSLAVSPIPAATFGLVNLILCPSVILAGMKPYSKRGSWPIVTYTTDVWTETMSTFIGVGSMTLRDQLVGYWSPSIYGQQHMYILGPQVELEGGTHAVGKPVFETKKLATALKKRGKIWQRDLTGAEIEDFSSAMTEERYPYLEAKVNGIVSPNAIVACACPDFRVEIVEKFLGAIGVNVELLVIGTTPELQGLLDWQRAGGPTPPIADRTEALYQYSWAVHDAVMGLGRTLSVRT